MLELTITCNLFYVLHLQKSGFPYYQIYTPITEELCKLKTFWMGSSKFHCTEKMSQKQNSQMYIVNYGLKMCVLISGNNTHHLACIVGM